jgi:hypothetical protein
VGNASLVFSDSGFGNSTTDPISIDPLTNRVVLIPGTNKTYSLKLNVTTGTFTGTFLHGNGIKDAFRGAIISKGANHGGFGYFLNPSTARSGAPGFGGNVTLSAGP